MTTEFENVPAATLEYLAKFIPVRPNAAAVAICQQRVSEKNFLRDNGFPHGPYREIKVAEDLLSVPTTLFPAILKIARFGYDGKGQAVVENVAEEQQDFAQLKGENCVLEQRLQLDYEISVVLARDARACGTFLSRRTSSRGFLTYPRSSWCICRDSRVDAAGERVARDICQLGLLSARWAWIFRFHRGSCS